MQIQLGLITYDGCELLGQVSRSTSSTPGLTTLSLSIELPINVILPQTPQLITCILSEDTSSPVKWFTGFYLGATAKPVNNNLAFMWTFEIVDVLYYLANSKQVNVYANSTTLKAHAEDISALAERPAIPGAYRYIDINVLPTDTDPFPFAIENNSFSLQTALAELSKQTGYEIIVQDPGWLNHENLFASTNAITRIAFRDPLANQQLAPVPLAIYDPTNPDFCDGFPFTDFTFGFHTEGITSAQTIGKNGAKAKSDGETIITSYAKTRSFPITKPQTDSNVPNFDFAFELSADINKLNFVAIQPSLGKIEVITPYDPNTPLTTKKCYFDRESKPPRVVFFQDDILGLTVDNTCYAQENFQFINVIETDTGASNALSSATHGAISTAYKTVNDPSIGDFRIARDVARASLKEGKKGFFCSGKRESTTENWLNGGLMRVKIPSQGIDKYVKVVSTNGSIQGKITENNELRDLINYSSITFSEVDKNIFNGNSFSRMARGANNQGFPSYDDKPFITTPTPTLCPIFSVNFALGSPSTDLNVSYLTTTDPKYAVLAGAGISVDSANDDVDYPLSKAGESIFEIDLTNLDYANVPSLTASIASAITANSYQYNPNNVLFSNIINESPGNLFVINGFNPPNQIIKLANDTDLDNHYNDQLYDNVVSESTLDLVIPRYSGFPSGQFFMRYSPNVEVSYTGEGDPPTENPARLEMKFSIDGSSTLFDSTVDTGSTPRTTSFSADPGERGITVRFRLRLLVHRPSNDWFLRPSFLAFGDTDRTLTFDFPDPLDPAPSINATQKVFIQGTGDEMLLTNLSSTGETATDSQSVDLKPYAGQLVKIKVQSSIDVDQISNYVLNAEARTDLTINCTDANTPDPGGGGGS